MKKTCLNDQDLTLYYYGELSESDAQHLQSCLACTKRLEVLRNDLGELPTPNCQVDELAGTRMAARVTEIISRPKRRVWLPAMGATAAAALVLVITLTSTPVPEIQQVVQSQPSPSTAIESYEGMPDIDFLEDIELLQELELLAQIEGV